MTLERGQPFKAGARIAGLPRQGIDVARVEHVGGGEDGFERTRRLGDGARAVVGEAEAGKEGLTKYRHRPAAQERIQADQAVDHIDRVRLSDERHDVVGLVHHPIGKGKRLGRGAWRRPMPAVAPDQQVSRRMLAPGGLDRRGIEVRPSGGPAEPGFIGRPIDHKHPGLAGGRRPDGRRTAVQSRQALGLFEPDEVSGPGQQVGRLPIPAGQERMQAFGTRGGVRDEADGDCAVMGCADGSDESVLHQPVRRAQALGEALAAPAVGAAENDVDIVPGPLVQTGQIGEVGPQMWDAP